MQWIKSYSIFTARQTDRCTFCIPICKGKIFSFWNFISFITLHSFVCFAHSLTSFVKDKFEIPFNPGSNNHSLQKRNQRNLKIYFGTLGNPLSMGHFVRRIYTNKGAREPWSSGDGRRLMY